MSIHSDHELEVSQRKLSELEEQYQKAGAETEGNPHVRDMTMRSLKRWINRVTEEIVRYESHAKVPQ